MNLTEKENITYCKCETVLEAVYEYMNSIWNDPEFGCTAFKSTKQEVVRQDYNI